MPQFFLTIDGVAASGNELFLDHVLACTAEITFDSGRTFSDHKKLLPRGPEELPELTKQAVELTVRFNWSFKFQFLLGCVSHGASLGRVRTHQVLL